jgi:transcriptional regulator with XRE-family HTH domain
MNGLRPEPLPVKELFRLKSMSNRLLARAFKVSPATVSFWLNGLTPVPHVVNELLVELALELINKERPEEISEELLERVAGWRNHSLEEKGNGNGSRRIARKQGQEKLAEST